MLPNHARVVNHTAVRTSGRTVGYLRSLVKASSKMCALIGVCCQLMLAWRCQPWLHGWCMALWQHKLPPRVQSVSLFMYFMPLLYCAAHSTEAHAPLHPIVVQFQLCTVGLHF
jgi:hypothetical protein